MSIGPGRVERAIEAGLQSDIDEAYDLVDLARAVWGIDPHAVEKKHRISLKRALLNVIARMPDWRIKTPRNGPLAVFNVRSELSHARACAMVDGVRRERREKYLASGEWPTRWHRNWRLHLARRDGDEETVLQIEAEMKQEMEQLMAAFRPPPFPMPVSTLTDQATPAEIRARHRAIAEEHGFSWWTYMDAAINALPDGDAQFRREIVVLMSAHLLDSIDAVRQYDIDNPDNIDLLPRLLGALRQADQITRDMQPAA